jgi:hypothetical protein
MRRQTQRAKYPYRALKAYRSSSSLQAYNFGSTPNLTTLQLPLLPKSFSNSAIRAMPITSLPVRLVVSIDGSSATLEADALVRELRDNPVKVRHSLAIFLQLIRSLASQLLLKHTSFSVQASLRD